MDIENETVLNFSVDDIINAATSSLNVADTAKLTSSYLSSLSDTLSDLKAMQIHTLKALPLSDTLLASLKSNKELINFALQVTNNDVVLNAKKISNYYKDLLPNLSSIYSSSVLKQSDVYDSTEEVESDFTSLEVKLNELSSSDEISDDDKAKLELVREFLVEITLQQTENIQQNFAPTTDDPINRCQNDVRDNTQELESLDCEANNSPSDKKISHTEPISFLKELFSKEVLYSELASYIWQFLFLYTYNVIQGNGDPIVLLIILSFLVTVFKPKN